MGPRQTIRAISRLFAVLVVVAFAMPSNAMARDVFEVRDVVVDVTAENAAKAREKALVDGERRAFQQVLQRLTLRADHARLPNPSHDDVRSYIKDFSVADEKTSAVRYLARLNFRFRADDIRILLRAQGIPFAETQSKPVLVLPVYQLASQILLWEDNNPWRETWLTAAAPGGLVPLILPLGDLQDLAQINAVQALNGDAVRLRTMTDRYGAGDTVVAFAQVGLDPATGAQSLQVTVRRHGSALDEGVSSIQLAAAPGQPIESILAQAVDEAVHLIEDEWKRVNLVDYGNSGVLAITVPVQSLKDWVGVKRRIDDIALVQRVETVLVSIYEVRVNLHHVGGADKLIRALEQADMSLAQEAGEWILIAVGGRAKSG